VKTMSTRCPLCGAAFKDGEPVTTATVPMPFGMVGVSFHKRCFDEDEAGAQAIVREAVGVAAAFVSSLPPSRATKPAAAGEGGSSPTPPPTIH